MPVLDCGNNYPGNAYPGNLFMQYLKTENSFFKLFSFFIRIPFMQYKKNVQLKNVIYLRSIEANKVLLLLPWKLFIFIQNCQRGLFKGT